MGGREGQVHQQVRAVTHQEGRTRQWRAKKTCSCLWGLLGMSFLPGKLLLT